MNSLLRLSLFFFSTMLTLSLVAQPANCIDFSDFESGTSYGQPQGNIPGEVIYTNQGTNIGVDFFDNTIGTNFGEMTIINNASLGTLAPSLELNNINAVFTVDGVAQTVCFTASNTDGNINFGINGMTAFFSGLTDPTINEIFPDNNFTYALIGGNTGPLSVCFSGVIESFSIGSDSGLVIDNVCTDYYPDNNCGFYGANLDAYCTSDDNINLSVDFSEIVGNNDLVDIFLDNEFYGFYPIESFPLNLENIPLTENQMTLDLQICINDDPDCCFTTTLDLPDCTPAGCVGFELYSDEMAQAFANGWPYDSVYHVENGVRFTQRQMFRNGELAEPNGLILRLAPNAAPGFTSGSFITIGHAGAASEIDLTGYSEPVHSVSFDFYRFTDQSIMNIGVNGQEVAEPNGTFQSGSGTTTLADGTVRRTYFSPFDPNLGTVEFFGQNITEIFFGGDGVAMDNLCLNQTECEITNLTTGQFACEDEEDLPARFFLDFDHNYLAQDSFILQIGPPGMFNTSTYAYGDLPLIDIQIFGTLGQVFDFTVTDQFFSDCTASVTTQLNDCESACESFSANTLEVYCSDPFFHEALVELSSIGVGQVITLNGLSTEFTQTAVLNNGNTVTFGYFEGDNDPVGYELIDGLTGCSIIIPPFPSPINDCM
ncbi:MAG: hypothetical protein AAGJ93_13365, partial [Bacteroidota bacterium]